MAGREGDVSSDRDSSDDEVNTGGHEPRAFNPGQQALHQKANPDAPGFEVLNEYVMDYLFRFLPVDDLKQCRLVNSSWNEACLRVIPKTRHALPVPGAVEDITRLISVISSSVRFPWTKFELNCSGITTAELKRATRHLLGSVAPFATSTYIYGGSSLRMLPGNYEFPALKHLKLSVQGSGLKFVRTILERAPSLDVLELSGNELTMERWMELFEVVNAKNISSLHLNSVIEDQHLIRLSQLGLQLKYLHLTFNRNGQVLTISSESLKTFLGSQSAYLEELELMQFDYYADRVFEQVEFPCMPKLTVLKIGTPSEFPNISYAELFPVLRKLEFGVMRPEMELDFFNEVIQPVEPVTELCLCCSVGCYEIMQAGRRFPRLKKVALPNEQKLLECMGMSMPNVEELWLICENQDQYGDKKKDVDPGLCGITQETYEELQYWPSSQLKVWEGYMKPPLCLKRLKKLRLIPRGCKLRLGKIGCRYGLLKLERLEILELAGDCSDVSNKVMKALRKKFTVVLLDSQ